MNLGDESVDAIAIARDTTLWNGITMSGDVTLGGALAYTASVVAPLSHCRLQAQVLLSHHEYEHSDGSRGWERGAQGGPGSTTTAGETEACVGQPPLE